MNQSELQKTLMLKILENDNLLTVFQDLFWKNTNCYYSYIVSKLLNTKTSTQLSCVFADGISLTSFIPL